MDNTPSPIYLAKERAETWVFDIEGVVGIGITDKGEEQAIVIMVKYKTPELLAKLPSMIEQKFPVVVEEVGNELTTTFVGD